MIDTQNGNRRRYLSKNPKLHQKNGKTDAYSADERESVP